MSEVAVVDERLISTTTIFYLLPYHCWNLGYMVSEAKQFNMIDLVD